MRFVYETRDKKVSALLHELEQEMTNMVPYRHYYAVVNCMARIRDTLEDLVTDCPNPEHAEKGRYALASIEMTLTGEIPEIDVEMKQNAQDITDFWNEVYEKELLARTQRKSDNVQSNK